jgi:protein-S-isoprenylcysteine O-methyltransferase Ste14
MSHWLEGLMPHIATTALCILSVVCIYAARILELRARRDTIAGQIRESATLRAFVLIGTFMCIGSIAEFLSVGPPFSPYFFAAGWALAIGSFWLRRTSIRALGKFWSLHVEIRPVHELVLSGPYRWMRHPTYLSMVLELSSFALLLQSRVTSAVTFALFVPTLAWRIRIEEESLVEKFGQAYTEYQRTTPALFPRLLRGR